MLVKIGIKLIKLLLRNKLTVEEANSVTEIILSSLGIIPIRDIIILNDQYQLVVNGKILGREEVRALRESSKAALENSALTLIREQVAYAAVIHGVHKAEVPAQMFFARAALWYHQQLEEKLMLLSQRSPEPDGYQD